MKVGHEELRYPEVAPWPAFSLTSPPLVNPCSKCLPLLFFPSPLAPSRPLPGLCAGHLNPNWKSPVAAPKQTLSVGYYTKLSLCCYGLVKAAGIWGTVR